MKPVFLAFALVLFTLAPVHGITKCEKIDACRCSTDEGEINIWSLAGQNPNGASYFQILELLDAGTRRSDACCSHKIMYCSDEDYIFVCTQCDFVGTACVPATRPCYEPPTCENTFNISDSSASDTYYQWNPCSTWTDQGGPCEDSAVCKLNRKSASDISRLNIGEHSLSECVLDEQNGQCLLTYDVTGNNQIKTSIALVCDDREIGKVDPMVSDSSFYSTSLRSICACPGRCLLDAKDDVAVRFDASNVGGSGLSVGAIVGIAIAGLVVLIVLLFAIFICCLRRKLPSGLPKPSICTTVKVGLGIIKKKMCPCC